MNKWWFAFSLLVMVIPPCLGKTIVVKEGASIQEAITKTSSYDTVLIEKGYYPEGNIEIQKPLTVLGIDYPIVDGQGKGHIITVFSDSVTIEGLQIQNTGVSYRKEFSAILLAKAAHVIVRDNKVRNAFFGIYVQYGEDCIIENNSVIGNNRDEASAGNAIHIWKADRIKILNNETKVHRDGIYLEFVDSSFIEGNESFNNLRYGLHFMFSNYDVYSENHFYKNGSGVAVMFSKYITMTDNIFELNRGGASYGILLKEISQGEMRGNIFKDNTIGVYAEGATAIDISYNEFISNGKAIDMKGNSIDNKITYNNFFANTFEVYTNTKSNLNHYDHNYWSQYRGYDLDKDGIGDKAYRPVNLMAIVSSHALAAYILLHSFLSTFLDLMERIFPQLIPETLIDNHPRMKPV